MPNSIKSVQTFPQLVAYLRDELDWPIESDNYDEISWEYDPEELGLKLDEAAKIDYIRQMRPLTDKQPFGIFFVKFSKGKLPIVAMRRILSSLVVKKRASAQTQNRPTWEMNDLLFLSSWGEKELRQMNFAHFADNPVKKDLPTLKVLDWGKQRTGLHVKEVERRLRDNLAWPEDTGDQDEWRDNWRGAFTLQHRQVITTSKDLAGKLAILASDIRERIRQVLKIESDKGPVTQLMQAFKKGLVHDLDEDGFADMYAQTIAYGLLSARIENPSGRTADDLPATMPVTNPFLKELMETFLEVGGRQKKEGGAGIDFDELGISEVIELLDVSDMEAVVRDFGDKKRDKDPVIHFYENFLQQYDPTERKKRGVFYTPQSVVSFIVRSVDELLRTEFGLEDGLADTTTWGEMAKQHMDLQIPEGAEKNQPFVQILDPATGTGTFPVEIIEVIYNTMTAKWKAEGKKDKAISKLWNDYVPKHLLPRLHGYELLMAPYAIAHLKIGLKLRETGYLFRGENRVRVHLTDSLQPHNDISGMLAFEDMPALAHEAQAANAVKKSQIFTILIGNPPYMREKNPDASQTADRIGGWIRHGGDSQNIKPIFDDFIEPLRQASMGVHAKLAYELSVMFWRLAVWYVFERQSHVGIVGMISPRAYIAGPGHMGMRTLLRKLTSKIWVTDLGGDNRGARKSDNIFDIETGVSIAICVKSPKQNEPICEVNYNEIQGTVEHKLAELEASVQPLKSPWQECSKDQDAFYPIVKSAYSDWPKLTDLFPWQHSGSQFKRLWPIGETPELLKERWTTFISGTKPERLAAFVETRDRKAGNPPSGKPSKKFTGLTEIPHNTKAPPIVRYSYRTLDRQWCILDERLADYIRPALVATIGPKQVFAATLMSKQLGDGPAVSISCHLPDMDYFCNRGAKDIIPLWRDASQISPNISANTLEILSTQLQERVFPEDLFCYCVAIMSGPAYCEKFSEELKTPGPRIPITNDAEIFQRIALLGSHYIWLHTYGERWLSRTPKPEERLTGSAYWKKEVPSGKQHYPQVFSYDEELELLQVGDGQVANVSNEVFRYSVSGFQPVKSWLRYRMLERGGRASRASSRSTLDNLRPSKWAFSDELLELLWAVEGCISLWPKLSDALNDACASTLVTASEIPEPTDAERKEPKVPDNQTSLL